MLPHQIHFLINLMALEGPNMNSRGSNGFQLFDPRNRTPGNEATLKGLNIRPFQGREDFACFDGKKFICRKMEGSIQPAFHFLFWNADPFGLPSSLSLFPANYSVRSAVRGLTRLARRAGSAAAIRAMAIIDTATRIKVRGSVGWML